MNEVEPTEEQICDNCGQGHFYWLLFFPQINKRLCEDCLEEAIGMRNELRFGIRNEL